MKYIYLFLIFTFILSCGRSLEKPSTDTVAADRSTSSPFMSMTYAPGVSSEGASTSLMKASYAEPESPKDSGSFEGSSNQEQFRIPEENIRSGTLTAGSFDDSAHPQVFRSFIDSVDKELDTALFEWGQHIIIRVQNSNNDPIGNARVKVYDSSSQLVLNTKTASDGRATLVVGWDTETNDGSTNFALGEYDKFTVKVTTENQTQQQQIFSLTQPTMEHSSYR